MPFVTSLRVEIVIIAATLIVAAAAILPTASFPNRSSVSAPPVSGLSDESMVGLWDWPFTNFCMFTWAQRLKECQQNRSRYIA